MSGFMTGLRDVSGTFSGTLSSAVEDLAMLIAPGEMLTFYAPAELSWRRALVVRLRRRPWPEVVVWSGHVTNVETTENPDGSTTVSVRGL